MPWIKILSGDVPGWDKPTRCHSPRKCRLHAKRPGRLGWKLVATDFPFADLGATTANGKPYDGNGWWCPEHVRELEKMMRELAYEVTVEDVPLPPASERIN